MPNIEDVSAVDKGRSLNARAKIESQKAEIKRLKAQVHTLRQETEQLKKKLRLAGVN